MKAILFPKYGAKNHLKLTELPKPKPSARQVLVKVVNSSNNAMDWHLLRGIWLVRLKCGLFKPSRKHNVLGADISGEIVEVGSAVTQFKKGDQVFGDIFTGGYAEYALASEKQLALKPENVSHEQAAAIPVAGMTALKGIRDIAKVKQGDHILINGASGGVGTFAVQIAKHFGAKVTAVCSAKNANDVQSIGADEVIDYQTADFCQNDVKYDHVIDVVGNRKPSEIRRVLKPEGMCVVIGFTKFSTLFRAMFNPSKQVKVVQVEASTEVLNDLGALLSSGAVKSHITKRFPLSEVPKAISNIGTRRVCGKQIIIH